MITFEKALKLILAQAKPNRSQEVKLSESLGLVLAEDLYSNIAMPPFDKSAMDGYAFKAAELKKIPAQLRCLGLIEAGENFSQPVKSGECVKIMTGAPLPKGTDSVIMVEDTQISQNKMLILKKVKKGTNVCLKGEDIKIGQKVLRSGKPIVVSDISLIAALGKNKLKTIVKPKVAVLNTGDEIVPLGKKLSKNKIYNSNGPQLVALLAADGIKASFLGIAKDKPKALASAIRKGLGYDVLLISGGVSMGDYDLVPAILKQFKVRKIFHKLKIKPGKPLFFGVKGKKLIFGIPGNPVSNFLAYQVFIRPALRKMIGLADYKPCFEKGILDKPLVTKAKRKHFIPVKLSKSLPQKVRLLAWHGSADILRLSAADAFMVLEPGSHKLKKGSEVGFIRWCKNES